jgi:hypothetical protein
MKYMLMVHGERPLTQEEKATIGQRVSSWVTEMEGRGVRLTGNVLRPVTESTTIRVREDDVLISDGPFAEAKEQMAGFDLIECADLDEAIEVAAKHPVALSGAIEIRPLEEED